MRLWKTGSDTLLSLLFSLSLLSLFFLSSLSSFSLPLSLFPSLSRLSRLLSLSPSLFFLSSPSLLSLSLSLFPSLSLSRLSRSLSLSLLVHVGRWVLTALCCACRFVWVCSLSGSVSSAASRTPR